jgi:hypothetical protein
MRFGITIYNEISCEAIGLKAVSFLVDGSICVFFLKTPHLPGPLARTAIGTRAKAMVEEASGKKSG